MLSFDSRTASSSWTRAWIYSLVLILIVGIYMVRKTLLVFVIALMFAYLLYPLVSWLQRFLPSKIKAFAFVLPFVAILSLIAAACWFVKNPVYQEANALEMQLKRTDFKEHMKNWSPLDLPIGQMIVDNYSQPQIADVIPQIRNGVRSAATDMMNFFIVPILGFFLLKDGMRIRDGLLGMFNTNHRLVESILRDAHQLMLQYMRALLFLCLATLLFFTIALTAMRVPYAALLSVVAFPLEFVPVIGPLIAGAIILCVTAFNGYPNMWGVGAFLLIYRLFQDYVLSPHLMKKGVKLHPLLVLFGVFAGGEIGGVGGIFLSVPLLALIRLIYFELRKQRLHANVLVLEQTLEIPDRSKVMGVHRGDHP